MDRVSAWPDDAVSELCPFQYILVHYNTQQDSVLPRFDSLFISVFQRVRVRVGVSRG